MQRERFYREKTLTWVMVAVAAVLLLILVLVLKGPKVTGVGRYQLVAQPTGMLSSPLAVANGGFWLLNTETGQVRMCSAIGCVPIPATDAK